MRHVEGYEHTGFFNRKYLPRKGDQNIGDQNLTNPNNYRSIRYADVLLMAAEANNRGNLDDTKALAYLNKLESVHLEIVVTISQQQGLHRQMLSLKKDALSFWVKDTVSLTL